MLLYAKVFLLPCRVSNDFSKSTKTIYSGDIISSDCSNMICSVLIWSAHTLCCLNSAWLLRSLESTAAPSRCSIMTLNGTSSLYNFKHKHLLVALRDVLPSSIMVLPLSPRIYQRDHITSLIATFSLPALGASSRDVVWPWTLVVFFFFKP